MDTSRLQRVSNCHWLLPATGGMRVPAVILADDALIDGMDDKVLQQLENVASLPGIVRAAYALPDAHWGYGFPIGGVAAFDANQGGVICAGGVGFDIACGVRLLVSDIDARDIALGRAAIADLLFQHIPAGMGSTGSLDLDEAELTAMLLGGARWAVERGLGEQEDLLRMEEGGCLADAQPEHVSERARRRQRREMGTLGSGNHYLEVQAVSEIHDQRLAAAYGLAMNRVCVSIHTGSRGLGHQIGTDYMREMVLRVTERGDTLPDIDLAYAPVNSDLGRRYLGAMRAAANCAMANREVITYLARRCFAQRFPHAKLHLLYDVCHNTCRVEMHVVDGVRRELHVHRKGATRSLGPGSAALPESLRPFGQPVLVGGSMGTGSWVLAGMATSETASLSSACHGAGRAMSRHRAARLWRGRQVQDDLAAQGIIVRSPSSRGIAEEAPLAYKDVDAVVTVAEAAGLASRVARLRPMICIKG